MEEEIVHDISDKTAYRTNHELDYSKKKMNIYQKICDKTIKLRLNYCRQYLNDDFQNVFFSDETHIDLNEVEMKCWGSQKVDFQQSSQKKQWKQSCIHLWGAISMKGKPNLYFFDSKINSETYIECMKVFIPQAKKIYQNKHFRFLQDNAKPHIAQKTIEYLKSELIYFNN